VARTIDRGSQWLMDHQDVSGFWSNSDHPALTGFSLMALQRDPEEHHTATKGPILQRGYRYLKSCVQEDGGIYRLDTRRRFDTSVSMLALLMRDSEIHEKAIRNARSFLLSGSLGSGIQDDVATKPVEEKNALLVSTHANILDTMQVLESLRHTQHVIGTADTMEKEFDRESALIFIEQCQFTATKESQDQTSDTEGFFGGFAESPIAYQYGLHSKLRDESIVRPGGSFSFAGLLSYLYADVELSDTRVLAVSEWVGKNFTLSENPGLEQKEVFLYYLLMAKAWTVMNVHDATSVGGAHLEWRHALALRLLNLQQPNGSWMNETPEGMEQDPVLTTSYALITLEMIYSGL